MTQEELDRLRKKLLLLDEEITDYLTKSEESAAAVEPDKGLGRLSRMEAMQDQQMVLELRRRKKRQKLEVANALSRIEKGAYGICSFCGKGIAFDRLDAFPEVQTCVTCA
tara:strand:- start:142 stop:471 length:330 start_codon:yes stop_codon:yes gene_type:complete